MTGSSLTKAVTRKLKKYKQNGKYSVGQISKIGDRLDGQEQNEEKALISSLSK